MSEIKEKPGSILLPFFPVKTLETTELGLPCNADESENYIIKIGGKYYLNNKFKRYYNTRLGYVFTSDGRAYMNKEPQRHFAVLDPIGSMFCYYLAEQVQVPCAKTLIVYHKNTEGEINPDKEFPKSVFTELVFNIKTEQFILANELNIDSTLESYEEFFKLLIQDGEGYKELNNFRNKYKITGIEENAVSDLFKICAFDFITMQGDRNAKNLAFAVNKETGILRTCAMFDNANLFPLANLTYTHPEPEKMTKEQVSMYKFMRYLELKRFKYHENSRESKMAFFSKAFVKKAHELPGGIKFLEQLVKNTDARAALDNAEQDCNFKIPQTIKENLELCVNTAVKSLSKALKQDKSGSLVRKIGLPKIKQALSLAKK